MKKKIAKTDKLVWRLGTLPSVAEITDLIDKDIITKDEAREILFTRQDIKEIPKEGEVSKYVTTHYGPPDTQIINRFVEDFFRPFWRM